MSENGNLPASPVECSWHGDVPTGRQTGPATGWVTGLTKREAFAMAAMQGFLASYAGIQAEPSSAHIALSSVGFADALLAALDQEPTP